MCRLPKPEEQMKFFFDPVNWDNFMICIGREKEETDSSAVN